MVASYPFDDSAQHYQQGHVSAAPDDAVFKHLAHIYANNHAFMKRGNICQGDNFKDGITNGAQWYDVPGGMEDFNYLHSNCFEITMELSCCKYPKRSELPGEWNNNREAMLRFMEASHMGVKGRVRDESGSPVELASVHVSGIDHNVTTTEAGEYWRLLTPGTYSITVSALGYQDTTEDSVVVTNNGGEAEVHDFTLVKRESPAAGGEVEAGMQDTLTLTSPAPDTQTLSPEGFLTSPEFDYHHYDDLQVTT